MAEGVGNFDVCHVLVDGWMSTGRRLVWEGDFCGWVDAEGELWEEVALVGSCLGESIGALRGFMSASVWEFSGSVGWVGKVGFSPLGVRPPTSAIPT